MSVPIVDEASDRLLATAILAGRIDVGLLAALDTEARREWGRKIARQLLPGSIDFAPPARVYEPVKVPLLDESVGDMTERAARRDINACRRDRAAGRVSHLNVPRDLLARLAPDLAPAATDPWGNPRAQSGGTPIGSAAE